MFCLLDQAVLAGGDSSVVSNPNDALHDTIVGQATGIINEEIRFGVWS